MLVLRCDTATTQGASLGELIPLAQQQLFLIRPEFLRHLRNPIWVSKISNRVPIVKENYHRAPKIRENRVPRIREIGSLKIHTGCLTFFLKKSLIRLLPVCKCKYHLNMHGKSVSNVMEKSWNIMEFGFENCVGTLIDSLLLLLTD